MFSLGVFFGMGCPKSLSEDPMLLLEPSTAGRSKIVLLLCGCFFGRHSVGEPLVLYTAVKANRTNMNFSKTQFEYQLKDPYPIGLCLP